MTKDIDLEERKKFIDWFKSRGLAITSIINYMLYYDRFGSSHLLSKNRANGFMKKFKYNGVVKAFLKNYMEFILENKEEYGQEIINKILEIKIPKVKGVRARKLPEVITESEVWKIEKTFKNERDKLMLLLSFYCGLRVAGLISIKPFNFNWEEWGNSVRLGSEPIGKLKVVEKGSRWRIVLVPYQIMLRLNNWIVDVEFKENADQNRSLFNIGRHRWGDLLKLYGKRALNKNMYPNLLRHSFATHLLNKGIKIERVQKLMGHKDISNTQIYTHIVQKDIEEDYTKLINFS